MKVIDYIKTPRCIGAYLTRHLFSHTLSDESFVRWMYLFEVGKFPNLASPQTYNEKIQWLKLNDVHYEYTRMVDKHDAKDYVKERIGEKYIIPTIAVWDSFDEIDFTSLPSQFVLKTTHDSGGVAIVKDKSTMNVAKIRQKIERSLSHNYFYDSREYPYRDVKPRIIAEKYMVDESGTELKDYKIFCFNGKPKVIQVDYDRFVEHKRNMYDVNWKRLPFTLKYPTDWNREFEMPENLGMMLELASELSAGIPHLRVDLYNINGDIYFGELTFFHGSGHEKFTPEEWNVTLGNWLVLPQNKKK